MQTITKLLTIATAVAALAPRAARADDVVVVHDDPGYCDTHWFGVGNCWHHRQHRPMLTLGAEFGVGALAEGGPFGFDTGTGSATQAGPVWGLRAGVDFLPWLGVEGRYVGMWNSANGNQGYVMSGGEAVVRLTLPTPFVRPYIFGGIGYYDFSLVGHDATGAFALNSSSQAGIPMGVGLEVPLTWHFSLAVEGTYRFQIGENFATTNDDIGGADVTTLTGVVKFKL
ncbi:MAG TPA: outer membrane beta-barrel protein [Polyangiaceae bacterium]|jgi:opacity protein-like surface antigen|nr:outer membrane beta-barrel protein [Polyangiaceae bacterium]